MSEIRGICDQNESTITQCLTDDYSSRTGVYVNYILNHKLICKCKCHKDDNTKRMCSN